MKLHHMKNYQPLLCDAYDYKRFAGNYVITKVLAKTDRFNRNYRLITVSDGSADLVVKCTNFELLAVELTTHSLVYIEASVSQRGGEAEFFCKNILPVLDTKLLGPDLSVLPRSLCPFEEAFDGLLIMADRIKEPLLRQFLRDVLLQPAIGLRYLQCPASLKYHHSYPGGLIRHSVSVAWNVSTMQTFNQLEGDIAIVAGLLHDIGKTKTLTPDMRRTAIGSLVDHAQLTLEICAAPLLELEKRAPGIAYQLKHAWTCYSPGARYGFKAKTDVARLIQRADHISATRQNWTTPDFKEQSYEWMHKVRLHR